MSQSPLGPRDSTESLYRYQQGWGGLNRLLHEGRSFSGRERNCAFLNCGGTRFVDISGASGFDFLDDARAIAAADWDFDGDLDLWMTCRTAPRLRLLENQSRTASGSSLALRLHGDGKTVNRDALGARVEIRLADDPKPLVRFVHGGDAFLSQNSSWLHFGLGEDKRIQSVLVSWPGKIEERFEGVRAGGFFDCHFGAGQAVAWQPPTVASVLAESRLPELPLVQSARIVLPARLPIPELEGHPDLNGPLLLNLWSARCPTCLAELEEWTEKAEAIRNAGLSVLLFNADGDPDPGAEYSFDRAAAPPPVVRNLDLFQRAVLDLWQPLPVPTTFLLDSNGEVAVIYKGPVSVEQILRDRQLLDAPPESWREAALPFPGIFISKPPNPNPLRVSTQLIDANQPGLALQYLERYARNHPVGKDVGHVIQTLRQVLQSPTAEQK